MDARSILHCDLSLYISWTRTDQHMIKQRLNVLRFTFLTSFFSKWIWHFKKTFNEKVPRNPYSSYVLDFSIPSIGGYLLAYSTPSSCRGFAPSVLSSINNFGRDGHAHATVFRHFFFICRSALSVFLMRDAFHLNL